MSSLSSSRLSSVDVSRAKTPAPRSGSREGNRMKSGGGLQGAIENALLTGSAVLVNDATLGSLIEGGGHILVFGGGFIELAGGDSGAELLLTVFQRSENTGVTGVTTNALTSAFFSGFCIGHNGKLICQRRELNPRPKAYESSALPLSYSGVAAFRSTLQRGRAGYAPTRREQAGITRRLQSNRKLQPRESCMYIVKR